MHEAHRGDPELGKRLCRPNTTRGGESHLGEAHAAQESLGVRAKFRFKGLEGVPCLRLEGLRPMRAEHGR